MPNYDLSSANLGMVANQNVDRLMIANQIVWEVSTADGPYYVNDALVITPTAYSDGTPNIVTGLLFILAVSGFVTGVRWYDGNSGAGNWILSLWQAETSNGATPDAGTSIRLATKTVSSTGVGYRETNFDTPIAVDSSHVYGVSRYSASGHYTHNPTFPGPHGALSPSDPVYVPGFNENISSIVSGWTSIRSSPFTIGGGDVVPQTDSSGPYYGLTPIFFKSL